MNVLIIEDNIILSENLKKTFKKNNFANIVNIIHSFDDFLYNSSVEYYDIILLDICLGFKNTHGIEILQHIRKNNLQVPIIVMSGLNDYRILDTAFSYGANDYIIKPFRARELQIRIKRWYYGYINNYFLQENNGVSYGKLYYDMQECCFYYDFMSLKLSKSSKYILLLFVTHKEKLIKNTFLQGKIWGEHISDNRNLRIKIFRLKLQLQQVGIDTWIKSIRGEGYILSYKNEV